MIVFEDEDVRRIADWLGPQVGAWFVASQGRVPAVRVPCETEDEWLAARKNGIGASEVGVIVGASSWASPYALWYRKKLDWRLPRTEAQRWGHLVEDPIAELFAEKIGDEGLVVKPVGHPYSLWAHPVQPWMICTPDRLVVDKGGNIAPVELKSDEGGAKDAWGPDGSDQVPLSHKIQVLWQAHIFGADGGWVVRKKGSGKGRLTAHWIPYDRSLVMGWVLSAAQFLTSIELDKPPPPDGHKSTTETLKEINPAIDAGETVEVDRTLAAGWRMAREAKADVVRREAEWSNRLRSEMGRAEFAAVNGEVFARRSIGKRAGYEVGPTQVDELRKVGSNAERSEVGTLRAPLDTSAAPTAGEEGHGDSGDPGVELGGPAAVGEGREGAGGPASDERDAIDEADERASWETIQDTLKEPLPDELAALIERALNGDPTERVHRKHRPWSELKHKKTEREQAEHDATTKES